MLKVMNKVKQPKVLKFEDLDSAEVFMTYGSDTPYMKISEDAAISLDDERALIDVSFGNYSDFAAETETPVVRIKATLTLEPLEEEKEKVKK